MTGLPAKLHRGQKFIGRDGTIHGARLERIEKAEDKVGDWRWKRGAFEGTRELNRAQIQDAFRSGGFCAEKVAGFCETESMSSPESK